MDKNNMCYCGLCCDNCAVKVKIEPASRILYEEMKKAGFEEIIQLIPGGEGFWSFLKGMAERGVCVPCKEGGGNPGCTVKLCAKEKHIEMCALCESYPCEKFTAFFKGYPMLKHDNLLLKEEGIHAWTKLQDERLAKGWTYSDEITENDKA